MSAINDFRYAACAIKCAEVSCHIVHNICRVYIGRIVGLYVLTFYYSFAHIGIIIVAVIIRCSCFRNHRALQNEACSELFFIVLMRIVGIIVILPDILNGIALQLGIGEGVLCGIGVGRFIIKRRCEQRTEECSHTCEKGLSFIVVDAAAAVVAVAVGGAVAFGGAVAAGVRLCDRRDVPAGFHFGPVVYYGMLNDLVVQLISVLVVLREVFPPDGIRSGRSAADSLGHALLVRAGMGF